MWAGTNVTLQHRPCSASSALAACAPQGFSLAARCSPGDEALPDWWSFITLGPGRLSFTSSVPPAGSPQPALRYLLLLPRLIGEGLWCVPGALMPALSSFTGSLWRFSITCGCFPGLCHRAPPPSRGSAPLGAAPGGTGCGKLSA